MLQIFFKWFYPILFYLLSSVIILSITLYPHIRETIETPPQTTYSFTFGHSGDYYLYLYLVSQGIKGNLLYTIPYTSEQLPSMFLHFIYIGTGYLLSPFTKNPIISIYVLRIGALLLITLLFYMLSRTITKRLPLQWLSMVSLICFTAFWGKNFEIPIPWADQFHVFRKFWVPPHHLLPMVCLMGIMLMLNKSKRSILDAFLLGGLSLVAGIIHPYLVTQVIAVSISSLLVFGVLKIQRWKQVIQDVFAILIPAGSILFYYYFAAKQVYPQFQNTSFLFKYTVKSIEEITTFLSSFGLVGVFSLLGLAAFFQPKPPKILIVLILWVFFPFVFFVFDLNLIQVVKTFLAIPFALLIIVGLDFLIRKRIWFSILVPVIILSVAVYGLLPFYDYFQNYQRSNKSSNFQIYVPQYFSQVLEVLKKTEKNSVVLASHIVSYMIPPYTNNRVILGQADSRKDYVQVQDEVYWFYSGNQTSEERRTLLKRHNISYIIFGIDAPPYAYPFTEDSFLQPVPTNSETFLVKVL